MGDRPFGPLVIRDPTGAGWSPQSRKAAELLAFLAMRRMPLVDRDVIGESLWPEADVVTARNRLRATLTQLRREIDGVPIETHGKRFLELRRAEVTIDYEVCERRLKWRSSLSDRNRADFARQILDVIDRGLLLDIKAPWTAFERDRYAIVAEELKREVAEARAGVVARFFLDEDLGGLDVPLVGRQRELAQVTAWLKDSTGRELHIVGTAGVGKTRILREALHGAGPDAVVAFSTVQRSEAPWLERLAERLEINGLDEVTRALAKLLSGFRRPLLVLDDLDQTGSAMRDCVDRLLGAVPHLRLLGTARRHPVNPAVEVCNVEPMPVAAEGAGTASDLLVRFATHFGVSEADCRRYRADFDCIANLLDGLPLALEIAAAWLPILSPPNLYAKLLSTPDLVVRRAGAGRDSLMECVSAMCQELDPEARHALLCLSQCRGGCGEALAESMLGSRWPWSIKVLVERSLALPVTGHAGQRFIVVQALREAVLLVENEDELAAAEHVWQTACLSLGRAVHFDVNERDRKFWIGWLRDEGENIIRAAHLADNATLATALDVLHGLRGPFFHMGRGSAIEPVLHSLIDRGLALYPDSEAATPTPIIEFRMESLTAAGRHREAFRVAAHHRAAVEAGGDLWRLAKALNLEARARYEFGDVQGAIDAWNQYSQLCEQAGYLRHALWIEAKLKRAHIELGRFKEAAEIAERAIGRGRRLGDDNSVGMYLKEFAAQALERREYGPAIDLAKGAVEAFRRTGETDNLTAALCCLGVAFVSSNRLHDARRTLAEAESICPEFHEELAERLEVLRRLIAMPAEIRRCYELLTAE